jgi:bacillithiol biosynthesis deacetylase BshB1
VTVPLDLLAIVAHPDDAELLCAGTLIRAAEAGHRTGVLDLTGGEAGTAGTAELREREAARATEVMGLTSRHMAGLPDGALENTLEARSRVAAILRQLRPDTVILQWPESRHPDHRIASQLAYDACFIAGLTRAPIEGERFRPRKVLYAMSYREYAGKPTFVVDISDQMERKLDAVFEYASQFEGGNGRGLPRRRAGPARAAADPRRLLRRSHPRRIRRALLDAGDHGGSGPGRPGRGHFLVR